PLRPPHLYSRSLHDALPISLQGGCARPPWRIESGVPPPRDLRRDPAERDRAESFGRVLRPADAAARAAAIRCDPCRLRYFDREQDRKSTRLNSSHVKISYAV